MKTFNWKTRVLMTIGVLALLAATSANAQTIARFQVPVQFLAGDKVLPAGEYQVVVNPVSRIVKIRVPNGSGGLYLGVIPDQRAVTAPAKGKLVLQSYGNVHALREVWVRGDAQGFALPKSKAERELARAAQANLLAKASAPATLTVTSAE